MSSKEWENVKTDYLAEDVLREARAEHGSASRPSGSAHLVGLLGAVAGQRFALGQETLIGRSADAHISLRARDLSRRHAKLTRGERGDYVVEDLGSANGTFVNGTPVQRQLLGFGDTIQLAHSTAFVFTRQAPQDLRISPRELGSVTQLAGGVAHHFNNLMAVIQSNLAYLRTLPSTLPLGHASVSECLGDVQLAADQASRITRQLLGFARLGKYEDRLVDVAALAREVAAETRAGNPVIEVEVTTEPELRVRGDATQLKDALANLRDNAVEVLRGAGRLVIRAEAWHSAKDATPDPPFLPAAVLTIQDNGRGMDAEIRDRAFEPFFTTKDAGSRTGLGLPSVYGVVKNHGGEVQMESYKGLGTTFRIFLPLSGEPPRRSARAKPASPTRKRVLVAESEATARAELVRAVEELGYSVLSARDGRDAIVRYFEQREEIGLAIIACELAGVSGPETARMLRRIQPTLDVFLSGRTTGSEEAKLRQADARAWLPRPFTRATVAAALSVVAGKDEQATEPQPSTALQQVPTQVGDPTSEDPRR